MSILEDEHGYIYIQHDATVIVQGVDIGDIDLYERTFANHLFSAKSLPNQIHTPDNIREAM